MTLPPPPPPPVAPAPRKGWFARHKILTFLLAAGVVAAGIAAVSDGDDEPAEADGPAGRAASGAAENPGVDVDTDAGEREPAEPGATGTIDMAGLDVPARDGSFEFVVTDVETGLPSIGEGMMAEEASGQFVVVRLSVTNIGDRSQLFSDSSQALIDDQGREHSADSATIWMDEGIVFQELNPGITIDGLIAFDIPADANAVALELHDSPFSGGVEVKLD